MQASQFKDLALKVYDSMLEYEEDNEIESVFCNAEGEVLEMTSADVDYSRALAAPHFSTDFKHEPFYWEAWEWEGQRAIYAIILSKPESISYREILTSIGHELAHHTPIAVQDSTDPYETDEGYQQEETKAIWFENYVGDVYDITQEFVKMFQALSINVT